MRRTTLPAFGLLAALLAGSGAPAAAAGGTGPYAGVVRPNQQVTHHYDNNPSGRPCIDLATTYRVQLSHAPTGDRLTLSVGSASVTSTNGVAALVFWSGVCTSFDIVVTGTSVGSVAAYTVAVVRPAPADVVEPALG